MPRIIISPYSQKMRPGATSEINPKNYPWWADVIAKLNSLNFSCVQIGISGETTLPGITTVRHNLKIAELEDLIKTCDTWAAVDNFFPHLCAAKIPNKPGVVVWGKSDPLIFGYEHNINLLKNRKFLRRDQYDIWEKEKHEPEVFVSAKKVVNAIKKLAEKAEKL